MIWRRVRLGRLSSVTIEVGYGKDLAQLGEPGDGRGAALVFGCYGLSLALHLFGLPIESRCVAKRDAAGVDLDAAYLLGYDNHLVSIVSSVVATLSNELSIYGSEAKIILPSPFLDATERILVGNETSSWVRRGQKSCPIRSDDACPRPRRCGAADCVARPRKSCAVWMKACLKVPSCRLNRHSPCIG